MLLARGYGYGSFAFVLVCFQSMMFRVIHVKWLLILYTAFVCFCVVPNNRSFFHSLILIVLAFTLIG